MTPAERKELGAMLERYEGRVNHLYLDTKGFVTCGIGRMLPNVEGAMSLPWDQHATVRGDYARVKAAPAGKKASWYAPLSSCRLPEAAMDAMREADIDGFLGSLRKLLAGYDSWPWPARRAFFDMIFNLGDGRLLGYPHLIAAAEKGDWTTCARECFRHGLDDSPQKPGERNAKTQAWFLEAAKA